MSLFNKALIVCLGVTLFGSAARAEGELHIYNWGDYTSPEMLKNFEKTYDVKVTLDTYDSSEEMLAKIAAGGTGYDVVVAISYIVPGMVEKDLVMKTEPSQMPNFKNMRPEFVNVSWDDGRHYSVPWQWGTTGISVNTDLYKGTADSWSLIFNPPAELKGQINVVPEMSDVMNAASFYLGLPLCSDKTEDLKKINDTIVEAKKSWRTMSFDVRMLMDTKAAAVTMNWNGASLRSRGQNPHVLYVYPKEGMASWMDNVVVLKDATNVENAKKFQDFMMDPKNAAELSTFAHYDNGIAGSDQYFPPEMKGAPEVVPPAGFKPNFVPACPRAVTDVYSKMWNNLLK